MSWVSWLALALSAGSCGVAVQGYFKAKKQLAETEELNRQVEEELERLRRWSGNLGQTPEQGT